jgi:hypothetical protein
MVAMGGRRPLWSVDASLTFPLDCSIAYYYGRLRSFWYKKKESGYFPPRASDYPPNGENQSIWKIVVREAPQQRPLRVTSTST